MDTICNYYRNPYPINCFRYSKSAGGGGAGAEGEAAGRWHAKRAGDSPAAVQLFICKLKSVL